MTDIRHIVFDIGKVLIHYDPELPFRRLIPDEAKRAWFLSEVCNSAWNIEQDRGRPWAEAEALLIARHPQEEELIRAFRRHWHEMVPHAYDDSVAILEQLVEAGRDVTLLTNFAVDTFAQAREMFPFFGRARGVTVSGEVGVLKPDAAIYRIHAETFGLDPAATLFIDDSARNVEGARAAGWRGVLFSDARTLEGNLAAYGL